MKKRKILRKLRKHIAYHGVRSGVDEQLSTLMQRIGELQRTVDKCSDWELQLAHQANAINTLRNENREQASLIAALTTQVAVLVRKLEANTKIVPVPAPTSAVEETSKNADNLEVIEGIGPKIAEVLKKDGITTFKQLASTAASRLEEILVAGNIRSPADPTTWPKQAELAAEGKMAELRALQATLDGGRVRS